MFESFFGMPTSSLFIFLLNTFLLNTFSMGEETDVQLPYTQASISVHLLHVCGHVFYLGHVGAMPNQQEEVHAAHAEYSCLTIYLQGQALCQVLLLLYPLTHMMTIF